MENFGENGTSQVDGFEWLVFHDGGVDNEAALVEAIYHDREPYGEYILCAGTNPEAVSEEGKASILSYRYLAEARVTFEEDLLTEAQADIDWCQQDAAEQGDAFVKEVWPSWQDVSLAVVANSIFPQGQDFVIAKSVLAAGEDAASWLEVTRIEADMPAEMALTFCRIEQDRLLEVKAVLKDADMPVYLLAEFWQSLVERFAELPYQKLSGAQRVEAEPEDYDFGDLDEEEGEA